MPIYELTADRIRSIDETSFSASGISERAIQRLLRSQIEVVSPDTLVIAEEFSEWEDCRRRIDLLGLDSKGNLVVIELKRTEDGGHMELQALRYAGMVSAMTYDQAVEVYSKHLRLNGSSLDASTSILKHLGLERPDQDSFAQDVRIVLVSAEFSTELTTAVLWLNRQGLDIRCVRMKPYANDGKMLIDVQQVIPLPEAEEITTKLKDKHVRERLDRREQSETDGVLQKFWIQLLEKAKKKTDLHARTSSLTLNWLSANAGCSGVVLNYVIGNRSARAELYIDTGDKERNKRIFDQLAGKKDPIEANFGEPLGWERLDDKRACRLRVDLDGSLLNEKGWPELQDQMIDKMIRFERALRPHLDALDSAG